MSMMMMNKHDIKVCMYSNNYNWSSSQVTLL